MMNHYVPLAVAWPRLPFTRATAREMRRQGRWPWVVLGSQRRLWIDLDGLHKHIRSKAPAWSYGFDLEPLRALASQFEFVGEVANS